MGLRERLIGMLGRGEIRSKEESIEHGKALRSSVPRESHAQWAPAVDRPDPVELLRTTAAGTPRQPSKRNLELTKYYASLPPIPNAV